MLELRHNQLLFSFPEIHPDAKCTISLQRTLRIPDRRGEAYNLPPGLGLFPVQEVASMQDKLAPELVARGGVALPMLQAEALYIDFSAGFVADRGTNYPMAIKISAGKRSAVTGGPWSTGLVEKDYLVVPPQQYLDGFVDSKETIRQFVAMPLGLGTTVEEQITGKAEFGGIQIEVYPMRLSEFESRFPIRPITRRMRGGLLGLESMGDDGDDGLECVSFSASASAGGPMRAMKSKPVQSMGMAAGGAIKQQIFEDPYGLRVWDASDPSRCFVHLFNSEAWKMLTGKAPPQRPPTAEDYVRAKLPWFDLYRDAPSLDVSPELAQVKSVAELEQETGEQLLPENQAVHPTNIKNLGSGDW